VRSTPWEDTLLLPPSATPGLGIEWDWEAIERLGRD